MHDGKYIVFGFESVQNGCNFYRVKQPCYQMNHAGFFHSLPNSFWEGDANDENNWLDKSDIVMSQMVTSEKFLEYMKEQKGKKKFVIDYDDNVFEISPYNPAYEFWGTKEVNYSLPNDAVSKLRDGDGKFNIERNEGRVKLFIEILKTCDMVTTPSHNLARVWGQFNKNVKVLKNFLNLKSWKPLNVVKDDYVRIGWQGGHSHFEDFFVANKSLKKVMDKYPKVRLVIFGQFFEGAFKEFDQARIEIEDWVHIDAYPYKMKAMNVDVGICPLKKTAFNLCKSEIKWEEFGSLGIPCVASDIPPYSTAVKHGVDGLLASTEEEWIEYLSDLIVSAEYRNSLGQRAKERIEKDYSVEKKIFDYESAYKSMYSKDLVIV